jgi:aminopeptidase YwaD
MSKRFLGLVAAVSVGALGITAVGIAQNAQAGRANRDVEALVAVGPRVAGSPALQRGANYLLAEYRKAGYTASIQPFTYQRYEDLGSSLTVGAEKITANALYASSVTDVQGRLVAVPNAGNPTDYRGVNARGAIVIVKRGVITFRQKLSAATQAGAVGIVLVNSVPGSLSMAVQQLSSIPYVTLSGAQGQPLFERASREAVTVRLQTRVERVNVAGKNVVAYLEGVTQPRVVIGGHMDSVPGSPGANDNASGTAATLEIARRIAGTPLAKQTWFVSFDGEEDGLRGSRAFVDTLEPAVADGMKGMLNFDMVGVNNSLAVGGSQKLVDIVRGINPGVGKFEDSGSSDHASFMSEGIPGVFFWRGFEQNYHSPGDLKTGAQLIDEVVDLGIKTAQKLLETSPN